ncbi:MAG: hypothetical protein ACJ76D_08735 [Solirubrobacterales bacterium]
MLSLTGGCVVSPIDPVPDPSEPPCPEGAHPPKAFTSPRSVATDAYGDIYVASYGNETNGGAEGRIDIFDPEGKFLSQLKVPDGPKTLAVDSKGNLYVFDFGRPTPFSPAITKVVRYEPTVYKPAEDAIAYENAPVLLSNDGNPVSALGVNRVDDHVFYYYGDTIREYSAAPANELLEEFGAAEFDNFFGAGVAVDVAHGRICANDAHAIKCLELPPPHGNVLTIKRSDTPFGGEFNELTSVAVDEGTGHVFVYDSSGKPSRVLEFGEGGEYVSSIEHNFEKAFGNQITIDNGKESPNGAKNPDGRYLYVPSGPSGIGHSFAFGPRPPECEPVVESLSFGEVTETEALLEASIEPCNLPTHYSFEYEAEEGGAAVVAGEGEIPAGNSPVPVSAPAEGLKPGTTYRLRVIATNEEGSDEAEGSFATYPEEVPEPAACPNQALRVGPSALLPDCRAYELVTPPDTNARAPLGIGHFGIYFATRQASPQGDAVNFEIEGGSIPGFDATGSFAGDPYAAKRTEAGWATEYTGPSGEEAPTVLPGSNSPDQGYSFWGTANGEGTAAVEEGQTFYVRYPDGHSALVGRGSLAQDRLAEGRLISADGSHIIFITTHLFHVPIPLEENAPPEGTEAIYDRTADEVTHVVSLLPGDETPAAGEDAHYRGASLDGRGVAFTIGSTLYLRFDNEETYEVGEKATFAGIAEGGRRIFYLDGGDLFAYEAGGTENPIAFSTTGDVTPVNVSADGAVAYFVSPSVLGGENPNGEAAQPGQENLYRSEAGQISFVGTVTERDVKGEKNVTNEPVDGLGLWVNAVDTTSNGNAGRFGEDPSRSTPDGDALLFSSRAALDGYDPEGHAEIYRYDFAGGELDCISCNPTLAKATGEATLQSVSGEQGSPEPFNSFVLVENLRPDGERAFFQSTEPLVVGDIDGLQDVYEWEARGIGSCEEGNGCLYLISSGQSERIDYIWGVSASGGDAFFQSSDLLTGADTDETPSIYDARVGGGFAEPAPGEPCAEEACKSQLSAPPALPSPGLLLPGEGNVPSSKHCPKGRRLVKRGGKEVCAKKKKHRRHRHHRKAGSGRKGARR